MQINKSFLILALLSLSILIVATGFSFSLEEDNFVEIDVVADNWQFEPNIIIVKKGDNVRLNIESIDTNHGITIPDFEISEFLVSGEMIVIQFVADKSGEYQFFCNVFCGFGDSKHGHPSMRGTLIVE
ncbi:hypothetical protein COB52_02660 [Candidatus Kaiserbacteria bacterium]|nr:MAG: hypothetical protein COB52_02660 [Candidatus Kaiserbacteria bacterium]